MSNAPFVFAPSSLARRCLIGLALVASVPAIAGATPPAAPTITETKQSVACGASSLQLAIKAPKGSAVAGTIAEVGSSAPATPFSVAAGGIATVTVQGNALACTGATFPARTFRVTQPGATPFDVVFAARSVELGPQSPLPTTGGQKANVTALDARLTCSTGAIQARATVKLGPQPPDPLVIAAKVDSATQPNPIASGAVGAPVALTFPTVSSACSVTHAFSFKLLGANQDVTIVPVSVSYGKQP